MKTYDAPQWSKQAGPADPRDWQLDRQPPDVRKAVLAADSGDNYLAWNDFRHRPAPPGWTPERLWALARFRRTGASRAFADLLQKDGAPFTVVVSDPLLAALQHIDTRAALWRAPGAADDATDPDATYRFQTAIEEAFHSSAIEGAVTTRRVAKEMIEAKRAPRTNSERMILNNFHTVERIVEWSREPLTPALLLRLQKSITEGTLDDTAWEGRFRDDDSVVVRELATNDVVHVPPPHTELAARMERLCRFANAEDDRDSFLHPVVRSILLHFQLAYDHPFFDGNGRTARALFLWSILRRGYWWFRSLSVSRAIDSARTSYYDAFRFAAGDEGDATYFVRQEIRCIEQEIDRLAAHLARRADLEDRSRRRARLSTELNFRQIALLDHALTHDDAEYTFERHRAHHAVTYPTAFHDLTRMEKAGLLRRRTIRRKAHFTPTPKLLAIGRR